MRRLAAIGAALILALAGLVAAAPAAQASTHAPCTVHYAGTPYLDVINGDGTSTLAGSGGIGGCPPALTALGEGVTITVALQWFNPDTLGWETQASITHSKGWSRYWRYARQDYQTVYATCRYGDWRVDVTGGDGWPPYEWWGATATFVPGDSGVCGAYGGGD